MFLLEEALESLISIQIISIVILWAYFDLLNVKWGWIIYYPEPVYGMAVTNFSDKGQIGGNLQSLASEIGFPRRKEIVCLQGHVMKFCCLWEVGAYQSMQGHNQEVSPYPHSKQVGIDKHSNLTKWIHQSNFLSRWDGLLRCAPNFHWLNASYMELKSTIYWPAQKIQLISKANPLKFLMTQAILSGRLLLMKFYPEYINEKLSKDRHSGFLPVPSASYGSSLAPDLPDEIKI